MSAQRKISGKPIEMREADFIREVNLHKVYPEDMRQAFISYWTEPNKSGSKMRFELERTWHTGRRLGTWDRNNFGNKSKTSNSSAPVIHIETRKPVQNEMPAPKTDIENLDNALTHYKRSPKSWTVEAVMRWPHLQDCYQAIKEKRLWPDTLKKGDVEKIRQENSDENYLKARIILLTFEWYGISGFLFSDTINARKNL